jgi:mRNA-degrading endonuclease toxin of MazEF toxin-antitoxin module
MGAAGPRLPQPRRGQIWFVNFPSDPPGKRARPVLIVSSDGRNTHPHASTVLVVPFSTTLTGIPAHLRLAPGETGLAEISELQPENVTTIRKEILQPAPGTRMLAERILRVVARNVVFAMGLQPREL